MNPYSSLPETAFWRTGCANISAFDIKNLWDPMFHVKPSSKVVTYGSCFAQHLGKALQRNGYHWLITEHSPYGLSTDQKNIYGYDVFSSRTGNIYTTSILSQWLAWSAGEVKCPEEFWEEGGRYYDPFRPNIEPNGYSSVEEMLRLREHTLASFKKSIEEADFFVFTLGLTESWINSELGYEYPMCPGTIAGEFDENKHEFINQGYSDVLRNLMSAISMMRALNNRLRIVLTVSPVPLTATKSEQHVLVATMRSKSVLRAVADEAAVRKKYIDYFPSYEVINSPIFRGMFFEPNLRSVNPAGVQLVMDNFFTGLHEKYGKPTDFGFESGGAGSERDPVCEESILGSFQ